MSSEDDQKIACRIFYNDRQNCRDLESLGKTLPLRHYRQDDDQQER